MSGLPTEIVEMLGQTLAKVVPVTVALALVFSVLAHFWACNPGRPWWRKRELVTDLCYWFLVPLFARVFRIGLLVLGAALLFGIRDADELIAFYDNGHGPLSSAAIMAAGDPVPGRGRFHDVLAAPHVPWRRVLEIPRHPPFVGRRRLDLGGALSPRQPAVRHHRGRCRAAGRRHFAGRDALARAVQHLPFRVRSRQPQLDARPVQIRLATPVFHRWHHTSREEGGDTNFAGTFPLWDILFGTFRMPKGTLPDQYGVDDQSSFPREIIGQLAYPFRK